MTPTTYSWTLLTIARLRSVILQAFQDRSAVHHRRTSGTAVNRAPPPSSEDSRMSRRALAASPRVRLTSVRESLPE